MVLLWVNFNFIYQMKLNELKYLVSEPHFNDRRPHDMPWPPSSALPPTQSLSSERLGSFNLPTHIMLIPTSVPFFIHLPPKNWHALSSPSWPSVWTIFQELLYEVFKCHSPQLSHLSLDFTFPLVYTVSLSSESVVLVIHYVAFTLLQILSLLPNTPTLSLALGQAWRRFRTFWLSVCFDHNKQKVLHE